MPYTEFYERSTDYRQQPRAADKKEVELFCACSSENDLPLTITQKLVIRVATIKGRLTIKKAALSQKYTKHGLRSTKTGLWKLMKMASSVSRSQSQADCHQRKQLIRSIRREERNKWRKAESQYSRSCYKCMCVCMAETDIFY